MTQEQILNARILALETSKWINRNMQSMSIEDLKNDAEIIFKWLTQR